VKSKWPKNILMRGITSGWLLYELARAPNPPGPELAFVQMACGPVR
jgi:hypothetical protein